MNEVFAVWTRKKSHLKTWMENEIDCSIDDNTCWPVKIFPEMKFALLDDKEHPLENLITFFEL